MWRGAGLQQIVEVWCHATPDEIAARYLARIANRSGGHLGADYVPELKQLAARAQPTGQFPVIDVDTAVAIDGTALEAQVKNALNSYLPPEPCLT